MAYRKGKKSPWIVNWRDSKGKLRQKSFRNQEDHLAFKNKIHREKTLLRAGLERPLDNLLFFDVCQLYIGNRYNDPNLSKGHVDQENSRLRRIWLPAFGAKPIQTITASEISEKLDSLIYDLKLSPAERNRHRAMLHKLFNEAVRLNKVVFNPVSKIPLLKEDPYKNKQNIILQEDIQETYIQELYKDSYTYGIIGMILLFTGCRVGTGLALKWGDVDFENETIKLHRTVDRFDKENPIKERQKSKRNNAVPLLPRLSVALKEHKLRCAHKRLNDFIAHREDGSFIPYSSFLDAHRRAVKKIGLDNVTPHGLRRTFATNAKRAGFTRSEIREILGHTSESVLERYDIKDIDHLTQKAKRLGFGSNTEANNEEKIGL